MTKKYEKPMALVNNDLAESVYMASGDVVNCYTVNAYIHQRPDNGNRTYRIQVDANHNADHHSTVQELTLNFSLPVTYISSNGLLISSSTGTTIQIEYKYHNNFTENIGLGDVVVEADDGLSITGASLSCNMHCEQHDS